MPGVDHLARQGTRSMVRDVLQPGVELCDRRPRSATSDWPMMRSRCRNTWDHRRHRT